MREDSVISPEINVLTPCFSNPQPMACPSLPLALPQRSLLVYRTRGWVFTPLVARKVARGTDTAGRNRQIGTVGHSLSEAMGLGGPATSEAKDMLSEAMAKGETDLSFFSGAMPKAEIGALKFLKVEDLWAALALWDTPHEPSGRSDAVSKSTGSRGELLHSKLVYFLP